MSIDSELEKEREEQTKNQTNHKPRKKPSSKLITIDEIPLGFVQGIQIGNYIIEVKLRLMNWFD